MKSGWKERGLPKKNSNWNVREKKLRRKGKRKKRWLISLQKQSQTNSMSRPLTDSEINPSLTWWSHWLFCYCVVLTADDKRRMGGSAEKRARRKRAEAEREAGPRGETGPGRIENKKKYPLRLQHAILISKGFWNVSFCQMLCEMIFFIKHFLDQDVQPTIQLSNYGYKQKKKCSGSQNKERIFYFVRTQSLNVCLKKGHIFKHVLAATHDECCLNAQEQICSSMFLSLHFYQLFLCTIL